MSVRRSDHSSLGKIAKSTERTICERASRHKPVRSMRAIMRLDLLKMITCVLPLKVLKKTSEKTAMFAIYFGISSEGGKRRD